MPVKSIEDLHANLQIFEARLMRNQQFATRKQLRSRLLILGLFLAMAVLMYLWTEMVTPTPPSTDQYLFGILLQMLITLISVVTVLVLLKSYENGSWNVGSRYFNRTNHLLEPFGLYLGIDRSSTTSQSLSHSRQNSATSSFILNSSNSNKENQNFSDLNQSSKRGYTWKLMAYSVNIPEWFMREFDRFKSRQQSATS